MRGLSHHLPDVRRLDLVAPAVGLVALVVYALHGVQGYLSRDLGVYAYGGQQVLAGEPPYVGILNRAGPLAHLIPALGAGIARLGGVDDLLGMRVLYTAIAVATIVVVYYVARDAFASKLVGLTGAGALLALQGFIEYASYGPREKTPMVFFMACALWAVTHRRWFLAGACVSSATLVLQVAFLPAIAAVLVGLALSPRAAWIGGLVRVVAGGALPVLVLLVYFLAEGAVGDFLDGFLLLNASSTPPHPIWGRLPRVWEGLLKYYGWSLPVLIVGVLGVVALVPSTIQRRRREADGSGATVLAGAAGAVTALVWILFDYDAWPDAFPVFPYAAIGCGALVAAAGRHVGRRASTLISAVTVATMLVLAVTYSVTGRSEGLVQQRSSTRAVLGALPADATLLSLEAPQPLVLSGRTNPIRQQMFSNGLTEHLEATWPGGLDGFLEWIETEEFDVVVIGDTLARRSIGDRDDRWLQWLQHDYEKVGLSEEWFWMAHESLGKDTINALRRALRNSG